MASTPPGVTVVNLSSLSLPQLDQLKGSLDEEIGVLTASMAQLKIVQQKYVESKSAVERMTASTEGRSLYFILISVIHIMGICNIIEGSRRPPVSWCKVAMPHSMILGVEIG
jgi:hypothetical protein